MDCRKIVTELLSQVEKNPASFYMNVRHPEAGYKISFSLIRRLLERSRYPCPTATFMMILANEAALRGYKVTVHGHSGFLHLERVVDPPANAVDMDYVISLARDILLAYLDSQAEEVEVDLEEVRNEIIRRLDPRRTAIPPYRELARVVGRLAREVLRSKGYVLRGILRRRRRFVFVVRRNGEYL